VQVSRTARLISSAHFTRRPSPPVSLYQRSSELNRNLSWFEQFSLVGIIISSLHLFLLTCMWHDDHTYNLRLYYPFYKLKLKPCSWRVSHFRQTF
jgi:hypothetical protein